MVATPIMRWLHDVDGPIDEFNQTVVLQAPRGDRRRRSTVLQAVLDRHATLRLRVEDDGAGGWSLTVPEPGSVPAVDCVSTVAALSDETLVAARSRLNPAAGVMLRAVWASDTNQLGLIIHHLAVDGVSWRILLEDFNIAWAQHHAGQEIALPTGDLVRPLVGGARGVRAQRRVLEQAETWRQIVRTRRRCPRFSPSGTPSPPPGGPR